MKNFNRYINKETFCAEMYGIENKRNASQRFRQQTKGKKLKSEYVLKGLEIIEKIASDLKNML